MIESPATEGRPAAPAGPAPPFSRIRARWLIPALVLSAVLGFVPVYALFPGPGGDPHQASPWRLAAAILLQSALLFVITMRRARHAGLIVGGFYAPRPPAASLLRLVALGASTIGLQMMLMYLVFAPLSLLAPEGVEAWILREHVVLYSVGPPYPWFGNLLGFIAGAIAAPAAEEWFFRGLLLLRWREKWGGLRAAIASSALFAVLHANVPGAFAFGLVMCALCTHYRSLWASTVVHVANNVLACTLSAVEAHRLAQLELPSAADLRASWWLPVAGAILALPLLVRAPHELRAIASWRPEPPPEPADEPFLPTN